MHLPPIADARVGTPVAAEVEVWEVNSLAGLQHIRVPVAVRPQARPHTRGHLGPSGSVVVFGVNDAQTDIDGSSRGHHAHDVPLPPQLTLSKRVWNLLKRAKKRTLSLML